MKNYDVLIIGAGPAGSSAAYFLGINRFSALLLDKEAFPRLKICSGGISPKSLKILHEMGLEDSVKGFHKITGTRITAPDGRIVEGRIPETKDFKPYGYVIPRISLDKLLIDNALSTGYVDFKQETVTGLIKKSDSIKGILTKEGNRYSAKIVVLASGSCSNLAKRYGLIGQGKNTSAIGLESWFNGIEGDDKIEIYYHSKLLPAYFWIFPEGGKIANIGLSIWRSPRYKIKNIQDIFYGILNENNIKSKIAGSVINCEPQFWLIHFNNSQAGHVTNGAIAIGDCAGLANPLTGEGIYYALQSGKIAAESIMTALKNNDVSARSLNIYTHMCNAEFGEDLKISYRLKELFGNADYLNALLKKASENPEINSLLQGVIVNVIPKKEIVELCI